MLLRLWPIAALVAALAAAPCQGAIRWLKSYEDGLKLAKETGRPLCMVLVVAGSKNVTELKKLIYKPQLARYGRVFVFAYEEVQIVNRTVSSRLFGKFKHQGTVRFPYFFFVGPDETLYGKTMDKSPSTLDHFFKLAYHKHGPVADSRKLKAALTKLKRADALYEKGKHGPAASLYSDIVGMKFKAPPVEAAKEKLAKIEEMANQQLENARADLKDKAYADAVPKLADLGRHFGSLEAGQAARKELAGLRKLPEAQEAFAALDRRGSEGETPAGASAVEAVSADESEWKLDGFTDEELDALDAMAGGAEPTPTPKAAADVSRKCRRLLGLARNWIANKQPDKARQYLRQVIEEYPDTLYAEQAKAILSGLQ